MSVISGQLSQKIYMVGSLYMREVVCNLSIQHDQGTWYSQSGLHKVTQSYPERNDTYRDESEMPQDFPKTIY